MKRVEILLSIGDINIRRFTPEMKKVQGLLQFYISKGGIVWLRFCPKKEAKKTKNALFRGSFLY